MNSANEVLTGASFLVVLAFLLVLGPWRRSAAIEMKLAARDLLPAAWRSWAAFLPSVVLAAALISGIAVEAEVRTGNARLIKASGATRFVVQRGSRDWINSSFVPAALVDDLNRQPGVQASGTERFFASDVEDLFVVSYDGAGSMFAPRVSAGRLASRRHEVVVDDGLGRPIGETVELAGQSFRIVGLTHGTSSLGKTSVFIPEAGARSITASSTYTVIGVVSDPDVELSVPGSTEVLTAAQFLAGNEGFWRRNGTVIVSSLLASIVVLSVLSTVATKRAELALARRSNAVLLALGARKRTLVSRELMKAAARAVVAVPLGCAFAWVLLGVLNARVDGLAAVVKPAFALWSLALMLIIPGTATVVALWPLRGQGIAVELSEG